MSSEQDRELSAAHWAILIGGGYGAFLFDGSEKEAEEMRSHKAMWERASGRKRPAEKEEISSGEVSRCMNHSGFKNRAYFVDCPCPDEWCVVKAQERLEAAALAKGEGKV